MLKGLLKVLVIMLVFSTSAIASWDLDEFETDDQQTQEKELEKQLTFDPNIKETVNNKSILRAWKLYKIYSLKK